jgi:hypothetical protein
MRWAQLHLRDLDRRPDRLASGWPRGFDLPIFGLWALGVFACGLFAIRIWAVGLLAVGLLTF